MSDIGKLASAGGVNFQLQVLKMGGSEKTECLEGLRVPAMDICLGGACYVSCQKNIFKNKACL